jgi:UDP-N-acetylglucosamine 2-epimerase (non-hydrolysing)
MRFLVSFGTRPEVIKLAPVIDELRRRGCQVETLFTGQHTSLFEDVRELVAIDHRLAADPDGQSMVSMFCHILKYSYEIVKRFDLVIVQGDTTSAIAVALAAFYAQKRVVHVEAGLRSWNRFSPFPEEMHRVLIDNLSTVQFCPSTKSWQNVRQYCAWLDQDAFNVGNTVYDALEEERGKRSIPGRPAIGEPGARVLVTVHRRESFGNPIQRIFTAVSEIAAENSSMLFIVPLHPNPEVQQHRGLLTADNIVIIPPAPYRAMVEIMSQAAIIMTDSGGVAEEALAFNLRPVILREETERDEMVTLQAAVIGGTHGYSIKRAFNEVKAQPFYEGKNPYGGPGASRLIVDQLLRMRFPND